MLGGHERAFDKSWTQCAGLVMLKSALNLGVARHVSKAAAQSSPESFAPAASKRYAACKIPQNRA
jgi:hypothetical protein